MYSCQYFQRLAVVKLELLSEVIHECNKNIQFSSGVQGVIIWQNDMTDSLFTISV